MCISTHKAWSDLPHLSWGLVAHTSPQLLLGHTEGPVAISKNLGLLIKDEWSW